MCKKNVKSKKRRAFAPLKNEMFLQLRFQGITVEGSHDRTDTTEEEFDCPAEPLVL